MPEVQKQQPTQNTEEANEPIQQSPDEMVQQQKQTAAELLHRVERKEEEVKISSVATRKLKELGFTASGRTIVIDNIDFRAGVQFDDNTKSVRSSIKGDSVEFNILNKDDSKDLLVISKTSIKYNGEEMILNREGDTLSDLRSDKESSEIDGEKLVQDLMDKYEAKGWVSQNVMWHGELKGPRIAVSEPVRGQDPIFEYRDGMFYPVNYPGSYRPMTPQKFDKYVRTTTHRNDR